MLTDNDYLRIAEIHAKSITQGFLTTLGIRFLVILYKAIDESDSSALIVAKENNEIVGFVAGSANVGLVYRAMLKNWFKLSIALLPALISSEKIYRIFETILFSKRKIHEETVLPSAELLSISVLPEYRGKKHAEYLFKELVAHFESIGLNEFKIVVGEALEPAHRFYCKMGAEAVAQSEVHHGNKSIIYIYKITRTIDME